MNDETFLQGVLANPKDDELLRVYSDWLEEQGDSVSAAKAEFLRLTVAVSTDPESEGLKTERQERLQKLAASLDTAWLAVVGRPAIENCLAKRKKDEDDTQSVVTSMDALFEFVCERKWDDLQPMADRGVRSCDECRQSVYFCDTIGEARTHAEAGHCIAVDLGVIRRPGDLAPEQILMGLISPEAIWREQERRIPDAVSAERERRKQEARARNDAQLQP